MVERQEGSKEPRIAHKFETINPIIPEGLIAGALKVADSSLFAERLSIAYPDLEPVGFTLKGIRRTLSPPIDLTSYTAGFESFLIARDAYLKNPRKPLILSDAAKEYVMTLLGSSPPALRRLTRDLTQILAERYEKDHGTIPVIEIPKFQQMRASVKNRTNGYIRRFPIQQPYVSNYLMVRSASSILNAETKIRNDSLAIGMVDANRILEEVKVLKLDEIGRVNKFANRFVRE